MAKAANDADNPEEPTGLPALLTPLRERANLSWAELLKRTPPPHDGYKKPTRTWLAQVVTGDHWEPGWVNADNMRFLAKMFGVNHAAIYQANAVSLGLDEPNHGAFASTLPAWVDDLPPADLIAVRDVIFRLGLARGLTD